MTIENSLSALKVLEETVVLTNFTALTLLLTSLATFVFADQLCDKQMKYQQLQTIQMRKNKKKRFKEKMPSESLR